MTVPVTVGLRKLRRAPLPPGSTVRRKSFAREQEQGSLRALNNPISKAGTGPFREPPPAAPPRFIAKAPPDPLQVLPFLDAVLRAHQELQSVLGKWPGENPRSHARRRTMVRT
jgi:hypothetical protein